MKYIVSRPSKIHQPNILLYETDGSNHNNDNDDNDDDNNDNLFKK